MTVHSTPISTNSTLDVIDWSAAWLRPLQHRINFAAIAQTPHLIDALNQQIQSSLSDLQTGFGQPLCFVPQAALPEGMAYETLIATTGQVPTRHNLHDFFNAAIWLHFPHTKSLLNRLQQQQIVQHGIQSKRGGVRDAITIFDENGAILVTCHAQIGQALCQFDWQNSLVQPRAVWDDPHQPRADAQAVVYLFGHALYEQLVTPRKALCAHTWVIHVSPDWFALDTTARLAAIDQQLAVDLSTKDLFPRMFQPLPVLGVPYFWPNNADPRFYDDTQVFRAGRRQTIVAKNHLKA